MVLVKLLGLVDLASGAALLLAGTSIIPAKLRLALAALLALKGAFFINDAASKADIIISLYLATTTIYDVTTLNIILGLYLALKGAYSLA